MSNWNDVDVGSNAYRHLKVKMVEEDNISHTGESDSFTIRPNNFIIEVPDTIRAGENFNMNLKVEDDSSNSIENYNESETSPSSFKIDVNLTIDILNAEGIFNRNDDFNYTDEGSLTFSSGTTSASTSILEVGIFDINISDGNGSYREDITSNCSNCNNNNGINCINKNGCPYACIDIVDDGCEGLSVISSATDSITVTPYAYAIKNITLTIPNSLDWMYMANINDLYAEVNATIKAQNILGEATRNFDFNIFKNDGTFPSFPPLITITPDINLSIENSSNKNYDFNTSQYKFKYTDSPFLITLVPQTDLNFAGLNLDSIDKNITSYFDTLSLQSNENFINAEANISLRFNIGRKYNTTLNPMRFKLRDINTTNSGAEDEAFNLGYANGTDTVSFYYGRVWAGNYETVENNQNVNITAEVYCKNCDDFIPNILGIENDIYPYWYKNIKDNFTLISNIKEISEPQVLNQTFTTSGTITNGLLSINVERKTDTYGKAELNITTGLYRYMWFNINNKEDANNRSPKSKVKFVDEAQHNAITKRRIDW